MVFLFSANNPLPIRYLYRRDTLPLQNDRMTQKKPLLLHNPNKSTAIARDCISLTDFPGNSAYNRFRRLEICITWWGDCKAELQHPVALHICAGRGIGWGNMAGEDCEKCSTCRSYAKNTQTQKKKTIFCLLFLCISEICIIFVPDNEIVMYMRQGQQSPPLLHNE